MRARAKLATKTERSCAACRSKPSAFAEMLAFGSVMVAALILGQASVLCHPPDFATTFFDRQFPRPYDWRWPRSEPPSPPPPPRTDEAGATAYQLAPNVSPKSYRLRILAPNFEDDFEFAGRVVIRVFASECTRVILLHSHRLDVLSVKITLGSQLFASTHSLLPRAQMLNITTDRELPRGNHFDVTIDYKGQLNDQSVGFYRSKYEINKKSKWLASTQFEPTFARMAFPCFDEPKFRAEFTISVARYRHQKVIGNMPLEETSSPIKSLNNRVVDKFQTTPFMPTYTVAFVVSEFPFFQQSRERFRVWARDDSIDDGKYALNLSEHLLKSFENFTKIRYDLPKVDLAAIPDMGPGAMENWGLMTFREPYVLHDTKSQSVCEKERVATALAHVLAHQWFGNCVTPASWNYLWLKEGFATYFEYFGIVEKKFRWRMNEKFVVRVTHYALSIDGIHLHRPMNGHANTPSEVKELFDGISYHKAAAVLRMIENFLSEELFQNAIKIYLTDRVNDGGVTTPDDLYNILELVRLLNQKPMPEGANLFVMMEQFADQVGYPLITVTRHSNGDMADVRIKQTPYRSPRSAKEIPDQIWTVPIACAKKSQHHMNNVEPSMWSYTKDEISLEKVVGDKEWYICNVQQTGYYRVNYDKENWNLIRDQLRTAPEEIHPLNRAQILDDSYTLALDERLSFSFVLSLLSYLKYETDPIPWYTGIEKLRHFYTQYEATSVAADLKRVAVEIVTNFYNFVGFDSKISDDQPTKVVRRILTMVCCELQISHCVSRSQSWYYRKKLSTKIPDDVEETVLCTIMRINSTESTWDQLWKYYRETHVAAKKETILSALGCSSNPELLKKYLSKLVDDHDDDIRPHNLNDVIRSVLRFYRGVTSTLSFIKDLLPRLKRSKKAHQVVIEFLNRMKLLVKSKEHEDLLNDSIEEAEKLDQRLHGDITAALMNARRAAQKNIEENDRRVSELSSAVSNYDRSNRKSKWFRHKSSSSSSSSSSISISATFVLLFLASFAPLHFLRLPLNEN